MVDAGMMYRSGPGPQGGDALSGRPSATTVYPQTHLASSQRVNPPLPPQMRSVTPPPNRGTTPPPSSWDTNPSTKRFSGNMDYLVPRISPVPQGGWPESYSATGAPPPSSQNQRGISPVPVGRQPIIMPSSGGTKFTFPPCRPQNGTPQPDYMGHQNVAMSSSNRQPPPPYPMNPSNRQSPTALQMQASVSGPAPSPPYINGGNLPQSMLVPNRNSHNLDMYNLGQPWSQTPPPQPQAPSTQGGSGQDLPPPSWPSHSVPVRSNSFNSPQMGGRLGQGGGPPSLPSSSQPSATTVTAITQAPILQPVKSMRVQKPELHTAVAPTHPPWIQQQQPLPPPPPSTYQETAGSGGNPQMAMVAEVPSYQGPPPPYPKHLLQQQQQPSAPCPAYEPGSRQSAGGLDDASAASATDDDQASTSSAEKEREMTEAANAGGGGGEGEKKQITTSPVPVRRNKRDEERRGEVRVPIYSPQAFKFFMEQHVENILKNYQMRIRRKKQLESEMQRVRTQSLTLIIAMNLSLVHQTFHFASLSLES